ncbi:MAG: hypothetical protein KDD64_05285 [Bdellovibrionales bacterium]|nr:hypothetical protein [Bdellovibrionales bacterium]
MKVGQFNSLPFRFFALCCLVLLPALGQATTYEYQKTFPPKGSNCASAQNGQQGSAGYIRTLLLTIDTTAETFSLTANYEECNGVLPDGSWLVLSGGPNPKDHAGQFPIIYFDGSHSHDNPTLSIYAYNGQNGPTSWYNSGTSGSPLPADRILSNDANSGSPNFVSDAFVREESDGTRTIHYSINFHEISAFIPHHLNGAEWEGLTFGDHIGVWYHSLSSLTSAYCAPNDTHAKCLSVFPGQSSAGFLKQWSFGYQGYYDIGDHETNTYPYCTVAFGVGGAQARSTSHVGYKISGKEAYSAASTSTATSNKGGKPYSGCYQVEIGETVHSTVTGYDPDDTELTITYLESELPPGANATPDSGTVASVPSEVNFQWTSTLADAGQSYTVNFHFTDDGNATRTCPIEVCVPDNTPPTCDIQVTSDNQNQCGGVETHIAYDGSGSSDAEDTLTYSWSTDCDTVDPQANLSNPTDQTADLTLFAPGLGNGVVGCQVTLTVSDGLHAPVSCSAPVEVGACDLDCLDQPNGDAQLDQCGVCNGNNACLDCNGIPNGGAVLDDCGVCGGSNECIAFDCAGTPNGSAEPDRCGICAGDGLSCIADNCFELDIFDVQATMDAGAKAAEKYGIRAGRALKKASKKLSKKEQRSIKSFVKKALVELHNDQIANWVLSWQEIPTANPSCTNLDFCTEVSNEDAVSTYNTRSEKMKKDSLKIVRKYKKTLLKTGTATRVAKKLARRLSRPIKAQNKANLEASSQVPLTYSSCS